jgi:hypothetical protein
MILANKQRFSHRTLDVSLDIAEETVKHCCLLHSFVREWNGYNSENTITVEDFYDMPANAIQNGTTTDNVCDQYENCFVSDEGQMLNKLNKMSC